MSYVLTFLSGALVIALVVVEMTDSTASDPLGIVLVTTFIIWTLAMLLGAAYEIGTRRSR